MLNLFIPQGTFGSKERIGDIYEFVNESLAIENAEFSLKKSAGATLTNMEATLAENSLAPASIINFKLESPVSSASGEVNYLKPEILALVHTQD